MNLFVQYGMEATKAYTLTNIVTHGNFDASTDWTFPASSYSSMTTQDGKTCIQLDSGSHLAYLYQSRNIVTGHVYYMQCLFKSSATFTTSGCRYDWIYNGSGEPDVVVDCGSIQTTTWAKQSSVCKAGATAQNQIRLFSLNGSAHAYYTDLVMVDLTTPFGLTEVPTGDAWKTWLDAHIQYFSGTMTVYK